MTIDFTSDDEISSPADFENALNRLILAALENGIEPQGSWEHQTNGVGQDLEILIVELAD